MSAALQLVLVRHGVAEDPGPRTGWRDEPRALTPEGVERMRAAAAGLRALDIAPQAIVSSPLTRCVQTAALLHATLGGDLRDDARLRPGMGVDRLLDVVLEHPGASCLMVCGHEPDISMAVSDLIGGGDVLVKKGSAALVHLHAVRPAGGMLQALLQPAMLRALGAPR